MARQGKLLAAKARMRVDGSLKALKDATAVGRVCCRCDATVAINAAGVRDRPQHGLSPNPSSIIGRLGKQLAATKARMLADDQPLVEGYNCSQSGVLSMQPNRCNQRRGDARPSCSCWLPRRGCGLDGSVGLLLSTETYVRRTSGPGNIAPCRCWRTQ